MHLNSLRKGSTVGVVHKTPPSSNRRRWAINIQPIASRPNIPYKHSLYYAPLSSTPQPPHRLENSVFITNPGPPEIYAHLSNLSCDVYPQQRDPNRVYVNVSRYLCLMFSLSIEPTLRTATTIRITVRINDYIIYYLYVYTFLM